MFSRCIYHVLDALITAEACMSLVCAVVNADLIQQIIPITPHGLI